MSMCGITYLGNYLSLKIGGCGGEMTAPIRKGYKESKRKGDSQGGSEGVMYPLEGQNKKRRPLRLGRKG